MATGQGAKDGRSPIRGQDRLPYLRLVGTHHHTPTPPTLRRSTRKGTTPPHHRTHPRCQRDRPAQDHSAAGHTQRQRTPRAVHPPPRQCTAVGRRARPRAQAGRQARRPRHAMYLPCCCPRTCQFTGRRTTSPFAFQTQEWSATVRPLSFAIRSGFWTRRCSRPHAAASFLSPEHLKPAGTCQERAKTQVSVHKGGVSWITHHRCGRPPSVWIARPRHGSAGATVARIRVGALPARGRRAPRRPSPGRLITRRRLSARRAGRATW